MRRGSANLVYVNVDYQGYARVGRCVFAPTSRREFDYDHALGRGIARSLGFTYVLLLRVPKSINRSHGRHERPTPRSGINLDKTCLTDARIFKKMLGRRHVNVGRRLIGYDLKSSYNPSLSEAEYRVWAFALGVDPMAPAPLGLTPIR